MVEVKKYGGKAKEKLEKRHSKEKVIKQLSQILYDYNDI